jgi:xanthine dehydrogenase accessory factor
MLEALDDLFAAWRRGEPTGVATVVSTFSSAPRLPGASMLVTSGGAAIGSVSGGCIDGAVYELCSAAVEAAPPSLVEFGVADELAMNVGLTCGGTIKVFVECIDKQYFPEFEGVYNDVIAGRPVAIATVIAHPDESFMGRRVVVRPEGAEGGTPSMSLNRGIEFAARAVLGSAGSTVVGLGTDGQICEGGVQVFITSASSSPRLIVFGANDFAASLTHYGQLLGFRVTLCDARPVFATPERYPHANDVVNEWPHQYLEAEVDAGRIDSRTALCVLTHDPKFDIPLLMCALSRSPAGYVGAMGSRRTHDQRVDALRSLGIRQSDLERLSSPIGLDLGGVTPQETALSIAAEIVMLQHQGTAARLSQTHGAIHHNKLTAR